jgi:hypothetical protein
MAQTSEMVRICDTRRICLFRVVGGECDAPRFGLAIIEWTDLIQS